MDSHVTELRHDEMERDRSLIVSCGHNLSPLGGGTSSVADAEGEAIALGKGGISVPEAMA